MTYHRFSESSDAHSVSGIEFEAHLEYLKKNAHVVSLNELVRLISEGEKLPANTTAITIDDGYKDAYEIAFPLLRKHELPATLFAITDFVDQKIWLWTDLMRFVLLETNSTEIYMNRENGEDIRGRLAGENSRIELAGRINEELKKLPEAEKTERIREFAGMMHVSIPDVPTQSYSAITWEQALEMDRTGIAIESHTVTHPILTNVDEIGLKSELAASKEILEKHLEKKVRHFCYPNGTYDQRVRDAVEKAGYASSVTTKYGFCGAASGLFELKRIDAQPSIEHFAQSVSGFERMRERIGI